MRGNAVFGLLGAAALFLTIATAHARQLFSAPRGPAFEVVSVKAPNRSGSLAIEIDRGHADRFSATNASVRDLIQFAYDVQDARVIGGPEWMRSERFDVAGTASQPFPSWSAAGPPIPLLLMVRQMLADRFGLRIHQETRDLPVYGLVVARDDQKFGPEITPSTLDCEGPAHSRPPRCDMQVGPGQMLLNGAPMSQFASALSNVVQRVVIDRTNLPGTFDFRLRWTPDANDASFSAMLREQLGLELVSLQAPLEILVIDRVERPTFD